MEMAEIKITCPRCKFTYKTIIKEKIPRTLKANAYYWVAVVGIPAQHFGYSVEEMHEALKWLFLRKFEEGKPETVRSTTELSTVEFSEYVEKCRKWAAEEGLVIPDPDEVLEVIE